MIRTLIDGSTSSKDCSRLSCPSKKSCPRSLCAGIITLLESARGDAEGGTVHDGSEYNDGVELPRRVITIDLIITCKM
jgi:hypothetical protein